MDKNVVYQESEDASFDLCNKGKETTRAPIRQRYRLRHSGSFEPIEGQNMKQLIDFLNELENRKIYYRLNKVRDSIMVEIAVPGQRWEVDFFADESIEIEKFISNGVLFDRSELDHLFEKFSD